MRRKLANAVTILNARRQGAVVPFEGVEISRNSALAAGSRLAHHVGLRDSTVGPYTSIGRYTKLNSTDIGAFCSISWDVTVGATAHPMDRATTHAFPYVAYLGWTDEDERPTIARTVLDADVWVGAGAIVLPGVRIDAGAVVAAGAVVTSPVGPYEIVAGVPARAIRTRFDAPTVDRLLQLRWWTWPNDVLRHHLHLFRADLTPSVLDRLEQVASTFSIA